MSLFKNPKIKFIRAVSPMVVGVLVLIGWVGDLQHRYGLILSAPVALLTPVAFALVLYGIFRSRFLLFLLILDGVSLCCSGFAGLFIGFILFEFIARSNWPLRLVEWLLLAVLIPAVLAGIPTLVLTNSDLNRLWIATRTYFGYPPKPPAEGSAADPAEFPVTPGWDKHNPKPPSAS